MTITERDCNTSSNSKRLVCKNVVLYKKAKMLHLKVEDGLTPVKGIFSFKKSYTYIFTLKLNFLSSSKGKASLFLF